MKTKTTQSVCSLLAILWIVTILTGCTQPILHNRPSDESCMDYLSGQKIFLEKGVLFDSFWVIQKKEFKEFDIVSISSNSDGTKSAKVKFELAYGAKGLDVKGAITYRVYEKEEVLQMLDFTPESAIKLGKW